MTEAPQDGEDLHPPEPEKPAAPKEEPTDWRVVAIIGIAVLLLLAAYVNRRFYGNKTPGPPAVEEAATPQAPPQAPAGPRLSPKQRYEMLRTNCRNDLFGTLFSLDGGPLILARPPLLAPSENALQPPAHEPGLLFDLRERLEGIEPTSFQRRGFFNKPGMAYLDSFPPLGLSDSLKLVIWPAEQVSLNIIGDNHVVIGVVAGGEARAYPLRLANYHEVVNDTLGGRPIAVAWSALALAAEAFDRAGPDGGVREFGSAGLLYQSAIVLYDVKTLSLWSPTRRLCLAGASTGADLSPLPAVVTTWKEWKRLHPETTALTGTDPVLNINYDTNPATPPDYYNPRAPILHPVDGMDVETTPMPLKTRVYGVTGPDGRVKAYAMWLLEEAEGPISDEIGGVKAVLEYNAEANILSARTEADEPLLVETMFWMAWFGAHPDTEVWQEQRLIDEMYPPAQPAAGPEADTGPAS
jgi:hypothetical protein